MSQDSRDSSTDIRSLEGIRMNRRRSVVSRSSWTVSASSPPLSSAVVLIVPKELSQTFLEAEAVCNLDEKTQAERPNVKKRLSAECQVSRNVHVYLALLMLLANSRCIIYLILTLWFFCSATLSIPTRYNEMLIQCWTRTSAATV
jgi:hypothetical protein